MGGDRYVEAFRQLSMTAHDAGLMRRRYGFYWTMLLVCTTATVAILVGVVLLGATWFQLILAALLGIVMAQLGFLGHEAAHQQIFISRGWNEWVSRVLAGLFTGLSYGWWVDKHSRHHANPNKERADPDAEPGVLSFTPGGTDQRTGLAATLGRYQGYYFLPLLLFEGLTLHADSFRTILTGKSVRFRWTEILFVGIRVFGYLALLFVVLPPLMAISFVLVQVAVFGFLLGGAFSPNHIGMPTVPHDADIDFLRRQVYMSRNVRGGPHVHVLMGGLEYQIEHHLFPRAPRPNLPALQKLVRAHCAEHGIPYAETTLGEAFRTIIAYLNQVGLKESRPVHLPPRPAVPRLSRATPRRAHEGHDQPDHVHRVRHLWASGAEGVREPRRGRRIRQRSRRESPGDRMGRRSGGRRVVPVRDDPAPGRLNRGRRVVRAALARIVTASSMTPVARMTSARRGRQPFGRWLRVRGVRR